MNNQLNVLYAADENYAPFLGVSMFSLLENNKDIEKITIYAVLDNVSEENKTKFFRIADDYGREFIFKDAKEFNEELERLNVPLYRGSYTTNYRMFFDKIISPDATNLLYIDCDTVVCTSLKPLLELDTGEKVASVVLDSLANRYKKMIGFLDNEPYFNAGIMFINVPVWKNENITEKLMNHIKTVRAQYRNPDQDLLNIVLKNSVFVLPPEYNFQPFHRAYSDKLYFKNYASSCYYASEQLENARKNPVILHTYRFLGEFPWHKGNLHPDTKVFDEYLFRSPWSDYIKLKKKNSLMFKIEKLLYKILPQVLFLPLFNSVQYRSFLRQDKLLREKNKK